MARTRIAAVLVAITLTGGCGGQGDDGAIRFWQFWDLAIIEPLVREFEQQNPGIRVEVQQLTWGSGLEKIQAAIAAGNQPDVCELGSTWLPRFSYEGVLEDLTPVYDELGDRFIMWESARWQEGTYGLPWVQGSRALFYNEELFERAGLDPQKPPETWDELLKAAKRIDDLGDGIYGFGLNMGERYVLYKKFMAFAWGNGGKILNDDGSVAFDSNENLEALEYYVALAKYSLKEKQEVLDHSFKNGLLGMQISGAWNLRNYAMEAPNLKYRVALVPRPGQGSGTHASFAGAEMLVVFKNSTRKTEALKLARFLQEYPQAKKISLEVKSVFPASRQALEDPDFTRDERVRVFLKQSLTGHTPPAHPGWIDIENVINDCVEEVLYGKAEPKESLHAAAGEIRQVLDRFE
jgi:multiple sugar transport system substrate-binding protein